MPEVPTLLLTSTETGLEAPSSAPAGRAVFRSVTTAEGQGWIGLARLEPGVGWPEFRERLAATVSDDQDRIIEGMAGLDRAAHLLGGAVVHPDKPAEFTADLVEGDHVLFDYPSTAAAGGTPRYQLLDVTGSAPVEGGAPQATIRSVLTSAGPRFELAGSPVAGAPLGFENAMPRPYLFEAVLFPIADDVTEDVLAAYFAQFVDGSGEWPPDPPFGLAEGTGCLPLSAGHSSVLTLAAPAGRYLVADWLKDPNDGVRLVKRGHFSVIELS
ncbi:hypothetical protein L6E12_14235 [Actinokineospora sp. PR83]|uniref:hypothetical protein n=1 Tax=Actinokineospora sp. PR83 TaxID=2884908 RepID=UPI001F23602D|nr:hypothetical protein [Actinokineospora sp. PR83]MCG8916949.1 hypothetical protein [Actinokineospora sp. PR83]